MACDSFTVLMIHADGTNGSTTFTDSSTSAKTVTTNGNAKNDTSQFAPLTGNPASALMDGSGDYLSVADSVDWDMSGDFTVDFWVRFPISVATEQYFCGQQDHSAASGGGWGIMINGGLLTADIQNSTIVSAVGGYLINTWYHTALVRAGTGVTVYVSGSSVGTGTSSSSTSSTNALQIGVQPGTGGKDMNGWIDEIRVSKGIARWTTTFTPPTVEYCQGGNFLSRLCLMGCG